MDDSGATSTTKPLRISLLPARRRLRYLLLCGLLAMPGVLVPREAWISRSGAHYETGWPITGMYITVGSWGGGSVWEVVPCDDLMLAVGIWLAIALVALWLRRWAVAHSHGGGATVQAVLTISYGVLFWYYCSGTIEMAWEAYRARMNWAQLERSARFARAVLPWLYGLGVAGMLAVFWWDSRRRPMRQRMVPLLVVILGLGGVGWWLIPYVGFRLEQLDEQIQICHRAQMQGKG